MALVRALGAVIALACIVTTGAVCAATPVRSPNVIVLLADDLGIGDLSINGAAIRTPNIDGLARAGAMLTHFYAAANVCTPSRAALLTGRYPIRSGLAHDVIQPQSTHGIPDSELTLAELLHERGYATALIGKWHLGHLPEYWPTRHGFDHFFGLPYSNDMQPLALYRGAEAIEQPVDQSTLTQRYTRETVEFIARNTARPFFILLAYAAPHIPLDTTPAFRGRSALGPYGDAVEELDASVGAILSALEAHGLTEDTLVFFTSDNGAWFEGSNADLRGMKGETYDGGYRVPFIARWPGTIPAGIQADDIAMNIDLLPTIAARTGAKVHADLRLDGRDLWPQITAQGGGAHEFLYLFDNENIAAIRAGPWKYLDRGYYRRNFVAFDRFESELGFDYPQLFDMHVKLPERYSVAAREPAVLRELQTRLARARVEFDPLRTQPAPATVP